jgi:hypothetical protein
MTKTYCDQCGETILRSSCTWLTFDLSEKEGEPTNSSSNPWTISIKLERKSQSDLCQHCLDDVMVRAFRMLLETRSTEKKHKKQP